LAAIVMNGLKKNLNRKLKLVPRVIRNTSEIGIYLRVDRAVYFKTDAFLSLERKKKKGLEICNRLEREK